MFLVDTALQAREAEGRPIRVALIGAGFMTQGLANHIVNTGLAPFSWRGLVLGQCN